MTSHETLELTPAQVGEQLLALREQQGIALRDIARQTCIAEHHLRALESGQLLDSVARPFAFGYFRSYANALGLDAEQWLRKYGLRRTVVEPPPVARDTSLVGGTHWPLLHPGSVLATGMWRTYAMASLALVAVSVLAWVYNGIREDVQALQADGESVLVPLLDDPAPLGELAHVVVTAQGTMEAAPNVAAIEAVLESPASSVRTTERQSPGAAAMIAQVAQPDRLVIVVHQDSWIDLSDNHGNRLYRNLARAGKKIDASGTLPFALHVGNAPGLSLVLNGKPFAIERYRADNSARLTLAAQ